jgi:hypothetical protein
MHPQPLAEVVRRVQRIVLARVESVSHNGSTLYQIEVKRDLLHRQPAGRFTFRYDCRIENLEFEAPGPSGESMHYSVMSEASGHEYEPKAGQDWIFLLYHPTGQAVTRVEPLTSLQEIEFIVASQAISH